MRRLFGLERTSVGLSPLFFAVTETAWPQVRQKPPKSSSWMGQVMDEQVLA
jgi:hypothetical protein